MRVQCAIIFAALITNYTARIANMQYAYECVQCTIYSMYIVHIHYPVQPSDTLLNGSHNCGCGNDVHFMNYTRKSSCRVGHCCVCVCVYLCGCQDDKLKFNMNVCVCASP